MIRVVAFNFLPGERDQLYLMPPSVRDWLPDDHLAWFVLDVVDELDLSGFYERYRSDGLGRAAYAPSVMVAVVLYAYCVGERSSRRIERRCGEDVAFRVLSANQVPDHATIARFVASNEAAFSALFCQVLALCATAGLVKVGVHRARWHQERGPMRRDKRTAPVRAWRPKRNGSSPRPSRPTTPKTPDTATPGAMNACGSR